MIPLQTEGIACYETGSMYACMIGDIAAAAGGAVNLGLLVGGVLMVAFYIAGDGELATPAILTVLLSGIMLPALPGTYRTIAYSMMFLAVFIGGFGVARRYILQVGT